ncbi:MAG: DUF1223 domain-containing protein [Acidobacteriales bacterium]|nr:DUF1223 domain-containing protein [Terriglobales bacterium]
MGIRVFAVSAIVLSGILFLSFQLLRPDSSAAESSSGGPRVPVIVELFTSEGCSSCPPADALLFELEKQPVANAEIIVLGEHVDYWNYIGWTDRFSSADFSERQSQYAGTFGLDSIYTPQMVVDGAAEFNGTSEGHARRAIAESARQPKAVLKLQAQPDTGAANQFKVEVSATDIPAGLKGQLRLFLAVTESGLESSVKRGENDGRVLRHTGVVRSLIAVKGFDPHKPGSTLADLQIKPDWKRSNLHLVAFLQLMPARKIVGAASIRMP